MVMFLLLAVLAYAWLGYPLALALLARRRKASVNGHRSRGEGEPSVGGSGSSGPSTVHRLPLASPKSRGEGGATVSILLAAHNEEESIASRLDNLLACIDHLLAEIASASAFQLSGFIPHPSLSILLGLDACTDRTGDIARRYAEEHPNIRVFDFKQRRGKVAVLKDLVRASADTGISPVSTEHRPLNTEHFLVFTDANTDFASDALVYLLAPFSDPAIGGVCGRLVLKERGNCHEESRRDTRTGETCRDGAAASGRPITARSPFCAFLRLFAANNSGSGSPEGRYWVLENWMKECESALDSCLGANGAIYAMRRDLFWQGIPGNAIIDDFVLGMKVREQGFRFLYEPKALAVEELPEQTHEWRRRVRIGAGGYQALQLCLRCLLPLRREGIATKRHEKGRTKRDSQKIAKAREGDDVRSGLSSVLFPWMFWSHKLLRWFTPHMLLALVALAGWQVASGEWRVGEGILSTVALLAGATGAGTVLVARAVPSSLLCRCAPLRPLLLWDHFVTMQAALLAGFLRFCRGGLGGAWERTPRGERGREPSPPHDRGAEE